MKINYLGKKRLSLVLALGAASVAFAQTDKDSTKSRDIEQVVLTGVADIAKDRKTPVAVSTIKEAQIVERLGNQEFPEILATTPSIYATKGGGGFGDGRVNIRGFDTSNTAVMINGVPVNDMEGGTVYWSNWSGLSDVTSNLQVQRGLGSSKLAIASVGGTINVITRAADKKREGNVTLGFGNNGYFKSLFSYNTGKGATGWSTSFLMSRTAGNTYIDGSQFEGYNYYLAVGYQPNKKHDFQFTFTGAPQWHNQNYQSKISDYIKYGNGFDTPNRRYNSNWGYLGGQEYSQTVNYYSKPVMSINWDWNMSDKSKLSTVLYASWGRGGGTGILGSINGKAINALPKTANGLIRYDDIVSWNQGGTVADFGAVNATPGVATKTNGLIRRSNINSHDWYGFLTNFQHKFNQNWNVSVGLDGRYYYGYHPGIVTDFLGNTKYLEKGDWHNTAGYYVTQAQNAKPSYNPFAKAVKDESQIVNRNYNGQVMWLGTFGQLEYTNDQVSAFLQGSVSEQGFQRIDNWLVDGTAIQQGVAVHTKTDTKYIFGYNTKGGVNYNINDQHNVFVNAGYYSKQPNQYAVYPYSVPSTVQGTTYMQILNKDLRNEKISSVEFGYGFKSSKFRANLNLYYTSWADRFVRLSGFTYTIGTTNYANASVSLSGVKEVHKGLELEAFYKASDNLEFNGMLSIGDWRYKNNPTGALTDVNGDAIAVSNGSNEVALALDNIKVADAAQTTSALGFTYKPIKNLSVFGTWKYVDNLYSTFSISNSYIITNGVIPTAAKNGTLRLPHYDLADFGVSYTLPVGKDRLIFTGNVYNAFDEVYISDGKSSIFSGTTGASNLQYKGIDTANLVYFGFGRTWAASISYRF